MDSKFDYMNDKIDGNNKYLKNLTITTIVGIGAMVIAVAGIAISIIVKRFCFKIYV